MQEGDAFMLCKIKAGLKLLITVTICSNAYPCINASSKFSRRYVCALGREGGRDGWMDVFIPGGAPSFGAGHWPTYFLAGQTATTDLSACLPKERVSHREVCRGTGAPHLCHCQRHFFGIGALLVILPRTLSTD